jgi:hypothetical protein
MTALVTGALCLRLTFGCFATIGQRNKGIEVGGWSITPGVRPMRSVEY